MIKETVYIVMDNDGYLILSTCRKQKKSSILNFLLDNDELSYKWKEYKKTGYSCKKFNLTNIQ